MVLCTGYGVETVTIGPDGEPVQPEHKPCDEAVNRQREEEHKRAGQRGEPRGCRLQRGCCQRGGRVDIRGDGVRAVLAIVLTAAA